MSNLKKLMTVMVIFFATLSMAGAIIISLGNVELVAPPYQLEPLGAALWPIFLTATSAVLCAWAWRMLDGSRGD